MGTGTTKGRKKININEELIVKEDDGTFTVPSETKEDVTYSVNMELRICSCPHGRLKGPCKHRTVVSTSQNIPSFDIVPEASPQMRQVWMYLGTGIHTPISYFLPLSNPSQTASLEENSLETDIEHVEADPYEEPNQDEMEQEASPQDNEEEVEETKQKLEEVFNKMKEMYLVRIKEDVKGYKKALDVLNNHLDKMPKTNDEALKKAVCTFGEITTAALQVRKRKNGSLIPVQVSLQCTVHCTVQCTVHCTVQCTVHCTLHCTVLMSYFTGDDQV